MHHSIWFIILNEFRHNRIKYSAFDNGRDPAELSTCWILVCVYVSVCVSVWVRAGRIHHKSGWSAMGHERTEWNYIEYFGIITFMVVIIAEHWRPKQKTQKKIYYFPANKLKSVEEYSSGSIPSIGGELKACEISSFGLSRLEHFRWTKPPIRSNSIHSANMFRRSLNWCW